MTKEEIKNLARAYAESVSYGDAEDPSIQIEYDFALPVIEWLSKDYCIVPKELIRREYAKAQKTHDLYTSATCINEMESRAIDHAKGRMCELTTLFGKSLFEEDKE